MREFLDLFHHLARTKSYRAAKLWAIGAGGVVFGQAYWVVTNQWELVGAACIPLVVMLSNTVESLAEANQVVLIEEFLEQTGQTVVIDPLTRRAVVVADAGATGAAPTTSGGSPTPYPARPVGKGNYYPRDNDDDDDNPSAPDDHEPLSSRYRVGEQGAEGQGAEEEEGSEEGAEEEETAANKAAALTQAQKLTLCQYYAFLYCVVHLGKTGEERLRGLIGIPARQYRDWLGGLAQTGVEIVVVTNGKTTVRVRNFEEAMEIIADFQNTPDLWDFPRQVYTDPANWVELEPAQPRTLAVKVYREEPQHWEVGRPATLLPRYPLSLSDLNLNF